MLFLLAASMIGSMMTLCSCQVEVTEEISIKPKLSKD